MSHDGLNPAHIPYWWVNKPTLGEFCFTIIGRADIERSKSNVPINAWLPQASYPCGNFSDTKVHDRNDSVSAGISKAWAWAATAIRIGPRPEPIGGPAETVPLPTGAHRWPPSTSLPTISSTL